MSPPLISDEEVINPQTGFRLLTITDAVRSTGSGGLEAVQRILRQWLRQAVSQAGMADTIESRAQVDQKMDLLLDTSLADQINFAITDDWGSHDTGACRYGLVWFIHGESLEFLDQVLKSRSTKGGWHLLRQFTHAGIPIYEGIRIFSFDLFADIMWDEEQQTIKWCPERRLIVEMVCHSEFLWICRYERYQYVAKWPLSISHRRRRVITEPIIRLDQVINRLIRQPRKESLLQGLIRFKAQANLDICCMTDEDEHSSSFGLGFIPLHGLELALRWSDTQDDTSGDGKQYELGNRTLTDPCTRLFSQFPMIYIGGNVMHLLRSPVNSEVAIAPIQVTKKNEVELYEPRTAYGLYHVIWYGHENNVTLRNKISFEREIIPMNGRNENDHVYQSFHGLCRICESPMIDWIPGVNYDGGIAQVNVFPPEYMRGRPFQYKGFPMVKQCRFRHCKHIQPASYTRTQEMAYTTWPWWAFIMHMKKSPDFLHRGLRYHPL